jgi:hypothetical protein
MLAFANVTLKSEPLFGSPYVAVVPVEVVNVSEVMASSPSGPGPMVPLIIFTCPWALTFICHMHTDIYIYVSTDIIGSNRHKVH